MPDLVFEAVVPTTLTFGSYKSDTVSFRYRARCNNLYKIKIQSREGVSVWDRDRTKKRITQRHTLTKGEKVKVKVMFRVAPVPFTPDDLKYYPQDVFEAVLTHVALFHSSYRR